VHRWDAAPREVEFLRHPHRHMFHIEVMKEVHHDDRDVEFIMLGRAVRNYLENSFNSVAGALQFGTMSCEMLARELIEVFGLTLCRVWEDGENGAEVRVPRWLVRRRAEVGDGVV
jgi:hypothetical protein